MKIEWKSNYLYIVNDAEINWGGLSDGSDLVAEEIGWFGQGWNSPSYTIKWVKKLLIKYLVFLSAGFV